MNPSKREILVAWASVLVMAIVMFVEHLVIFRIDSVEDFEGNQRILWIIRSMALMVVAIVATYRITKIEREK